jgi:phosphoribosylformimino-5-aminoimidazole carboxamide ribotide isomerase
VIAIPAVDLRDGACVQLVGGSYDDEKVRIADPLEAVQRWTDAGFTRLHVVDLDAATGKGSNGAVIGRIMGAASLAVQVGGGIRSTARVHELLDAGATSVVVGTRAVQDPAWLAEIATAFPGRIILAADVRDRSVVTHGWASNSSRDIGSFVREVAALPLAGILVTAVHLEGRMSGTDCDLMGEIADLAPMPVIASGGIASIEELRALARRGLGAAVLGMSLYTGALDASAVATEFSS